MTSRTPSLADQRARIIAARRASCSIRRLAVVVLCASHRRTRKKVRYLMPSIDITQLKVGGQLVMPLGPADAPQQLTVIEKIAPSETRMRSIILVNFVPFTRSQD